MKRYSPIYVLLLLFVLSAYCKGQNQTNQPKDNIKPETKDATTSHGPSNIVRNMIQDNRGNIWIASWQGIFKYDGKSFTNITSKVSSARFFSVLEDKKGNMWFGSIGSGVYYYDGKSFRNFTTRDGLADNGVTDIYEDKTGNIWFATGSGASLYDGKSFRNFKMKEGLSNNNNGSDSTHVSTLENEVWSQNDINTITEDNTGKFWFGTKGSVYVYDGKTFTNLTNNGKRFANVRSIIKDKKGNIWLGGENGLWRYDGHTFANFTHDFIGYFYEDKAGNIWTISNAKDRQWALSRYDEKSLTDKTPIVTPIMSIKKMLCGILEANDGSIWFGASDGVYRYDGSTITHL